MIASSVFIKRLVAIGGVRQTKRLPCEELVDAAENWR
jgi:hypothetical protein